MALRHGLKDAYSPTLFLAALGNGGLTVSFFIYLLFLVPRPPTAPIPTFDTLWPVLTGPNPYLAALVAVGMVAIAGFAARFVRLLVWNLSEYRAYKRTEAYQRLKTGNAEVSLMTIPLTLAMAINVGFVVGAVFVPGLWSVVEYLFPAAILAFAAVAVYGGRLFLDYFGRIIVEGKFDHRQNNNLSQLIAIFAFAMIGVGFAAPAAMSTVRETVAVGTVLAIFMLSAVLLFALVKTVIGFRDMLEHGIGEEASPSLWIMIPILTVCGIALVRLTHGLHAFFDGHTQPGDYFVMIALLMGLQATFGLLGWTVMRRLNYFKDYLHGDKYSPMSFTLICPGVALYVFGMFFVHLGLVKTGLVDKFSIAHFALMAPLVYVQVLTIVTNERLVFRLLKPKGGAAALGRAQANPAE